MEGPPSPKCVATVRCDDDRESVRDGIRVDGKWKHQPIYEGGYQGGSLGTCMFLIQNPRLRLTLMITW